jgi:hypothetical protein
MSEPGKLVIAAMLTIVLSNFMSAAQWPWFHYTTADGKFQFDQLDAKGRNLELIRIRASIAAFSVTL